MDEKEIKEIEDIIIPRLWIGDRNGLAHIRGTDDAARAIIERQKEKLAKAYQDLADKYPLEEVVDMLGDYGVPPTAQKQVLDYMRRRVAEWMKEGVVWEGELKADHFTTGAEMDIEQTDLGGLHVPRLKIDDGETVQVTVRKVKDAGQDSADNP